MNELDRREFIKLLGSGILAAFFGKQMKQLSAVVDSPIVEIIPKATKLASEMFQPGETYQIVYKWWKTEFGLKDLLTVNDIPAINDVVDIGNSGNVTLHNSIVQIIPPMDQGSCMYNFTPRGRTDFIIGEGQSGYIEDPSIIEDIPNQIIVPPHNIPGALDPNDVLRNNLDEPYDPYAATAVVWFTPEA